MLYFGLSWARSCGHGQWARFQDFRNDDNYAFINSEVQLEREILLQQQMVAAGWCRGREGEREL